METFERCIYSMKFVVSSFRHFEHMVRLNFIESTEDEYH